MSFRFRIHKMCGLWIEPNLTKRKAELSRKQNLYKKNERKWKYVTKAEVRFAAHTWIGESATSSHMRNHRAEFLNSLFPLSLSFSLTLGDKHRTNQKPTNFFLYLFEDLWPWCFIWCVTQCTLKMPKCVCMSMLSVVVCAFSMVTYG